MKKILFFLFFLGNILASFSQTNVYHPFPDSNAIWSEYHHADQYSGRPSFYYRNILGNTDTTIVSQTYHKLFKSFIDTVFVNDTSMHYLGGIRQNNKKIFYLPKDSLNEYLLYDFSLQIGDTFLNTYSWFSMLFHFNPIEKLLLYNVDSIKIENGSYRKTFHFAYIVGGDTGALPECWIEGIGCSMGLLCQIAGLPINSEWNSIVCFIDNNNQIRYQDDYFTECFSYNSVIETSNELKAISISPNPFSSSTQITLPQTYHNIILSVYDIQGKLVSQYHYIDTDKIILNRYKLNNGMYFLKLLLDEKGLVTGKVIING